MADKKETASDEIKDDLVNQYRDSKPADWKRKSKKTVEYYGPSAKRVFANAKLGIEVVVYEVPEYDASYIHEAGPMIFFAEDLPEEAAEEYDVESGCMVMFAAETFWNRNHHICDQHQSNFLEEHCGLDLTGFEELSENQFLAHMTAAEVIARLTAQGLRHEPEMKRAGQWEGGDEDGDDQDYDASLDTYADQFPHPQYAKTFDDDLGEFKTAFTRDQARAAVLSLALDNDDDEIGEDAIREQVATMGDDALEESLCSSGIIHDASFGGFIDAPPQPLKVDPGLSQDAAQPGDHKITTAFIVKNLAKRTGREIWTFESYRDEDPAVLDARFGPSPRVNNTLFRFRSVKAEGEFDYAIAFAPLGTEGSLFTWDGEAFIPEQGELLFGPASDLFTKQWHRAPEVWTHVDTLGGGFEMYSSPVEYPPYEDGGPVTEEAIIAALHEAFDHPGWLAKPMSSDWTFIPGLGDELRTRYNGKGHMGKLRMYQGKINGVPTKAAVFSPNERDANRLEVCEYDEVVYFGFHDPEDVDGDAIVWAGMRSQVEREGVSDQHQDFALIALNGWPGDEFDEACENYFEDNKERSREEIKARLEGLGFVYREEFGPDV